MNRGQRRDNTKRMKTRRFNNYGDYEVHRINRDAQLYPRRGATMGFPSYFFACQDFRMIGAWWIARIAILLRLSNWMLDQHNCSCSMCRSHTRKVNGNGWRGKSRQEIKELLKVEEYT